MSLGRCGPQGAATLQFLGRRRIKVSLHKQPTAARWTLGGHIQLHPRYAEGPPDAPYALSLIVHEVQHLRQGILTALSVYGELEAWQVQFALLKSLTRRYHPEAHNEAIITDLMSLSLNWDRGALLKARNLMRAYAGPGYRADLLPLYPLHREIVFWLGQAPALHA